MTALSLADFFEIRLWNRIEDGHMIPAPEQGEPQIIKPRIPFDNQELLENCKAVYDKNREDRTSLQLLDNNSGAFFRSSQDVSNKIFVRLSPKDLANFSTISKCCYLATKADLIWEIQLQNCFPGTTILSKQQCSFSPEQQFKIYYHARNELSKPFIVQLQINHAFIAELRGSTGFNGLIDQAWQEYQRAGGAEAKIKYEIILADALANSSESEHGIIYNRVYRSNDGKVARAFDYYFRLNKNLKKLAGKAYNGTEESLALNSQQARCLRVIQQEIPPIFNKQNFLEIIIQDAEAAKNNGSSDK
jgi:hypothetical protein